MSIAPMEIDTSNFQTPEEKQQRVFNGEGDPTVDGGFAAEEGCIYHMIATPMRHFHKSGPGDTDWTEFTANQRDI